jgi:hypothetical protein
MNPYEQLDASKVAATLLRLRDRIRARFPDRHLVDVANELQRAVVGAQRAQQRPPGRRIFRLFCSLVAIAIATAAFVAMAIVTRDALHSARGTRSVEWLPIIESGVNDIAFAAVAIFFLVSIGQRLDRRAALAGLHKLRTLAHVIDMHQLTKDPERLLSAPTPTEASVALDLTGTDLGRYLDYCSELLSLVGKTAALYAQVSTDAVVLDTVAEIENLVNGLSRKIWQKIAVLHQSPTD